MFFFSTAQFQGKPITLKKKNKNKIGDPDSHFLYFTVYWDPMAPSDGREAALGRRSVQDLENRIFSFYLTMVAEKRLKRHTGRIRHKIFSPSDEGGAYAPLVVSK